MMTIKAGLPRATPKGTERSDDNRIKVSVKHRIWIGFPPAHSTQRLRKVSVYSIQFAGVNCGSRRGQPESSALLTSDHVQYPKVDFRF